jgi:hypothetical protein
LIFSLDVTWKNKTYHFIFETIILIFMSTTYTVTYSTLKTKSGKKSNKNGKQHETFQLQADNLERAKSKAAKAFRVGQSTSPDTTTEDLLKEANAVIQPLDGVEM